MYWQVASSDIRCQDCEEDENSLRNELPSRPQMVRCPVHPQALKGNGSNGSLLHVLIEFLPRCGDPIDLQVRRQRLTREDWPRNRPTVSEGLPSSVRPDLIHIDGGR